MGRALFYRCAAFEPATSVLARSIDEACERSMDPLEIDACLGVRQLAPVNRAEQRGRARQPNPASLGIV